MLTNEEKDNLYELISAFIGEDQSIKQYKNSFTERTVEVVEGMIQANLDCNAAMKELLVSLLTAGKVGSRGWLKRSLAGIQKSLKYRKKNLRGYGCLVSTKSKWRSEIIISAI